MFVEKKMINIIFASVAVNEAAQKAFTMGNWNSFVNALNASCVHLPACYEWMEVFTGSEKDFVRFFGDRVSLYLANEDEITSVLIFIFAYGTIKLFYNSSVSIEKVINLIFDMSYRLKADST